MVCTVKSIKDFGAFVSLDEYDEKEGLIHVSEIAPGWVKHIMDYVREGQKVVCKVLSVEKKKGHIDLSLKDVKKSQRDEKIKEWKEEQKARKWFEIVTSSLGIGENEIENIRDILLDNYNGLYSAFEDAAINGVEVLKEIGIEEKCAEEMYRIASANIKKPVVQVKGYIELTCPLSDGVEVIKCALKEALSIELDDDEKLEIKYVGAPKYLIRVQSSDYKRAEKLLRSAAEKAIRYVRKRKGEGKLQL